MAEEKAKKIEDLEAEIDDLDDAELQDEENAVDWTKGVVILEDDPSTPAFTFRVVLLGCIWAVFYGVSNALFSFRSNFFTIPNALSILLSYPIGVFFAAVLPDVEIAGIKLNPGPFTVKEHALISIIANAAGGLPTGVDNVVGQRWKIFMGDRSINFWNSIQWVLSTQFIGYGVAGLTRRFLIKPAAMLWPGVLPTVALLNSFHEKKEQENTQSRYTMSRFNFFWIVLSFIFMYEWFPLYFAPFLATISIACWFGNSRTMKILGSSSNGEGTGLLALTFDWSVVSGQVPLATPFWAALNYFGGYAFWTWIVGPIVYYTNPFGVKGGYISQAQSGWGTANTTTDPFPYINAVDIFDKQGGIVKIQAPLLQSDLTLNQSYYDTSKPFHLSPAFAIAYFTSFINITALFAHVGLWYGKDIYKQAKEAFQQLENTDEDPLNVRMRQYKDVPDWFYMGYLAFFSIVLVISGLVTAFKMKWWATIFAIVLGVVYTIPIGIIQGISGQQMGINVLTEFLIGLIIPGDIIGVMCFKSLGYNLVVQALALSSDLKMGHYMAIAPVYMFIAQSIGTFIGAVCNNAVAIWAEDGLAEQFANNKNQWDPTPSYGTFTNAGGIWGAIGPARFFGPDSPYFSLMSGFIIGIVVPFIPWLCNKLYPSKNWHLFNLPLLTQQNYTAANQAFIVVPFLLNFIFNKLIFKYKNEWWTKYNFIMSIALDSGTAFAILVITLIQFAITDPLPNNFFNPATADYYCLERNFTQ
ncbi:hypothetical protein HDV04_005057 [Boothiomyces sp. JEL0838]|nr:hypothetical protein HDV04_005057 [Boothiomyces sp. JEL0838]